MIVMRIYSVMGECRVEAEAVSSMGEVGTKVNWQGPLDESSPVDELTSHVTNALLALDRVMGEVHEEVLFGS